MKFDTHVNNRRLQATIATLAILNAVPLLASTSLADRIDQAVAEQPEQTARTEAEVENDDRKLHIRTIRQKRDNILVF